MSCLAVNDLSVALRGRRVLQGVSFDVGAQELIGLVGANGAGKTTLMRACLGLIPHSGRSSLAVMTPRARGQAAAWGRAGMAGERRAHDAGA